MVNKTTDDTKVTKKTTKKTTRRKPSKKKDAAAKKPLSEKNARPWPCSTSSSSCKWGRRRAA